MEKEPSVHAESEQRPPLRSREWEPTDQGDRTGDTRNDVGERWNHH
jgi:hypothetical protein